MHSQESPCGHSAKPADAQLQQRGHVLLERASTSLGALPSQLIFRFVLRACETGLAKTLRALDSFEFGNTSPDLANPPPTQDREAQLKKESV
jgi:hypothetical protein